jgi:hypothetical protein
MGVYRRLTNDELQALPLQQQAEARAFDAYLDAARRKAPREELRMLGLLLELAILSSVSDEETETAREDSLADVFC